MSDEVAELRRELDIASYILSESTGILHSYGVFGGVRTVVWKVIFDGRQTGLWTKRRWAKRDLRQQQRAARRVKAGAPSR